MKQILLVDELRKIINGLNKGIIYIKLGRYE